MIEPDAPAGPTLAGPGDTTVAVVVASVGTDHHPFDRLIRWIDSWAAAHPAHPCFVQRGRSGPTNAARSEPYVGYTDLVEAMAASMVVVSHGGPATIMDARTCGRLPVVVPRRADLGEHVDDHQVRFGRWMAERQQVLLAESEGDLHRLLDMAIADPSSVAIDLHDPDIEATIERFAGLVDGLLDRRGRR